MKHIGTLVGLEDGDDVMATYNPECESDIIPRHVHPANLQVRLGDVTIFGPPDLVVEMLCNAFIKASQTAWEAADGAVTAEIGDVA